MKSLKFSLLLCEFVWIVQTIFAFVSPIAPSLDYEKFISLIPGFRFDQRWNTGLNLGGSEVLPKPPSIAKSFYPRVVFVVLIALLLGIVLLSSDVSNKLMAENFKGAQDYYRRFFPMSTRNSRHSRLEAVASRDPSARGTAGANRHCSRSKPHRDPWRERFARYLRASSVWVSQWHIVGASTEAVAKVGGSLFPLAISTVYGGLLVIMCVFVASQNLWLWPEPGTVSRTQSLEVVLILSLMAHSFRQEFVAVLLETTVVILAVFVHHLPFPACTL